MQVSQPAICKIVSPVILVAYCYSQIEDRRGRKQRGLGRKESSIPSIEFSIKQLEFNQIDSCSDDSGERADNRVDKASQLHMFASLNVLCVNEIVPLEA